MKVIDLSHVITEGMPVYPGTEGPRLECANTYAYPGLVYYAYGTVRGNYIENRHNGRCPLAMVDGHVEQLKRLAEKKPCCAH